MKSRFFLFSILFSFLTIQSCDSVDSENSVQTCSALMGTWCLDLGINHDPSKCDFRLTFNINGTSEGTQASTNDYESDCSSIDFYQTFLSERTLLVSWKIISLSSTKLVVQKDNFNNTETTYLKWN